MHSEHTLHLQRREQMQYRQVKRLFNTLRSIQRRPGRQIKS
jgi:hypothetical protein